MGVLGAIGAGASAAAKPVSRPPPPVSGGAITRIGQAVGQGAQQAAPQSFASAVSQGAQQGAQQAAAINGAAKAAQAVFSPQQRIFDATLSNLFGGSKAPTLGFLATAYGPPWNAIEGGGTTSTGIKLGGQLPVIAVDPSVIPYGSIVRVSNSPLGKNQLFVAADTGGAIKGNHIDFFVASGRQAQNGWGARQIGLQVLQRGAGPNSVRPALQKVQAAKAQVTLPQTQGRAAVAAQQQQPAMAKERLFANPQRPASFAAGGAIQVAQGQGLQAMRNEALRLLVPNPAKRQQAAQVLASPSHNLQASVNGSGAASAFSQAPASSGSASSAPASSAPAPSAGSPALTLQPTPASLQQSMAAAIPTNVAAQAQQSTLLDALLRSPSAGSSAWNLPTRGTGGGAKGLWNVPSSASSSPYLLLANALLRRGATLP